MLAKAIEKIESLAFAKERCNVEEIEIHGQGYIHQGDSLTRIVTPDISAVQVRSLTALRSMVKKLFRTRMQKCNGGTTTNHYCYW